MTGESDRGADDPFARSDPPLYAATLWPHRSLTPEGFRLFMGALGLGLAFPLAAAWGTPAFWVLAPIEATALGLVGAMIALNDRARRLSEEVRLWPDAIAVERRDPDGRVRRWRANPYWVTLEIADTRALPRYLTLKGGGRTIELGAFLTPEEREALARDLRAALAEARRAQPSSAR